MFRPVSPKIDFVAIEAERARPAGSAHDVFARSMQPTARAQSPGSSTRGRRPPTACPACTTSGPASTRTSSAGTRPCSGRFVERRAGWDTHGLPVEVEVEKQPGHLGQEPDRGAGRHRRVHPALPRVGAQLRRATSRRLTERIGYWTDMDARLLDLPPRLRRDRCGGSSSSSSTRACSTRTSRSCPTARAAARRSRATSSASPASTPTRTTRVGLRAPSSTDAIRDPALPGCDAPRRVDHDAVDAAVEHRRRGEPRAHLRGRRRPGRGRGPRRARSSARRPRSSATLSGRGPGRPALPSDPSTTSPSPEGATRAEVVVGGDYVTTEDGTGLVHLAPAFGEIDRQVGREHALPTLNPVGPRRPLHRRRSPGWPGARVREANTEINDELERRGLLLRRLDYVHSLPHCWRCGTVLIYWGKPSWYIATCHVQDERMIAENATSTGTRRTSATAASASGWPTTSTGRSRATASGERRCPIWRCEEGHLTCVGSPAELSELAGTRPERDRSPPAGHRRGQLRLPRRCGGTTRDRGRAGHRRLVRLGLDARRPGGLSRTSPGSAEAMEFPADFITEAIDQTRGWFYSLLAVNTLVFGATPYRHVLCLGHIVDADGPQDVASRWATSSTPGRSSTPAAPTRCGGGCSPRARRGRRPACRSRRIDAAMRDMLGTLWNTFSFFTTYASLNGFDPDRRGDPAARRRAATRPLDPVAARRRRRRGHRRRSTATSRSAAADALAAPRRRPVELVRAAHVAGASGAPTRTRPPVGLARCAGDAARGPCSASTQLLAPFCPFVADHLWRGLDRGRRGRLGAPGRLARWRSIARDRPRARGVDGRGAPAHLARARRSRRGGRQGPPAPRRGRWSSCRRARRLRRRASSKTSSTSTRSRCGASSPRCSRFELVPELPDPRPSPRRGGQGPQGGAGGPGRCRGGRGASRPAARSRVQLPDGERRAGPEDLELRVKAQEGFAVSREGGEVVALDLTLDEELLRRGLVRDVDPPGPGAAQVTRPRARRPDRALHLDGLDDLDDADLATIWRARSWRRGAHRAAPGEGEGSSLELDEQPAASAWLAKARLGAQPPVQLAGRR